MRKLYFIDPSKEGFEDAKALFDEEGKLFHVADVYHGEDIDMDLLTKLGVEIIPVKLLDLFDEEDISPSERTDELPNHQRILTELPKWIKEQKWR